MSRLRIGLIGAGSMGSLHARVISASAATELVWVADPAPEIGNAVASRTGSSWLAEPRLGDVDAVVVAAPTQFHFEIASSVLEAGLPLLMEKPLASDLTQVATIVQRSSELDIPLMCGLLERFNPAVRTAIDIVESPWHVRTVRHSPYVPRIRTGVASDLLIHDADLAIRVFGRVPTTVRGQMAHLHPESDAGSEDVAEATMLFADGQIASLSASRLAQRKVREMVIVEHHRSVEVDLLRQDITIYRHVGEAAAVDDDGLGYRQQAIIDIPVIRHLGEPLALQLAHFVSLIEGRADAEIERASILPPHQAVFAAVGGSTHP
jgi:predicted dehydrogenase